MSPPTPAMSMARRLSFLRCLVTNRFVTVNARSNIHYGFSHTKFAKIFEKFSRGRNAISPKQNCAVFAVYTNQVRSANNHGVTLNARLIGKRVKKQNRGPL